ncbi:MAG: hypothetical protein IAI49_04535, partial [Candidatus Eremiobacteraeota bacterium]|nr:hypothetical protein [Candidatus Eremiobacteraeota bacterium]
IDAYLAAYARALDLRVPPAATAAARAARNRDYWERPMAFTDRPEKPRTLVAGNPFERRSS